jgi:hypothetical protein
MDIIEEIRTEHGMAWLCALLAERLKYNRTWAAVEVVEGKNKFSIIWSEPKNPTDHSKMRDVKPYNTPTLTQMIYIQEGKLREEQKENG